MSFPKVQRKIESPDVFSDVLLDAVSQKPSEKGQYSSLGLVVIPSFKKSIVNSSLPCRVFFLREASCSVPI